MPLPGPPPGRQPITLSSNPTLANEQACITLQQLRGEFTGTGCRDARWRAIKLLRLLLLRLDDLSRSEESRRIDDGRLQQTVGADYVRVYLRPRLSEVGILSNIGWVAQHPLHFDVEWFGPQGQWWWPFQGTGRGVEEEVATALLHYLEASLGLQPSGIDPATWSWPNGISGADWYEKFASPGIIGGGGFDDLTFEVYVDDKLPGLSTSVSGKFRISAPYPFRQPGWYD